MPTPPTFTSGQILTSSAMNSVGLWLVKTQAVGSSEASVEVTGAFSSDYANYKIIYSGGVGSTGLSLNMQFGIGATMTDSNYYGGIGYIKTGANTRVVSANNGGTSFIAGGATSSVAQIALEVQGPQIANSTHAQGPFARLDQGQIGNS
jgi:hypothetical protein